jgi:hypothetical protein
MNLLSRRYSHGLDPAGFVRITLFLTAGAVLIGVIPAARAAYTLDSEIEVTRQNLFTVSDYTQAKKILPAEYGPRADELIAAAQAGYTHRYTLGFWAEGVPPSGSRVRAVQATLTTPRGVVFSGQADSSGGLSFPELDDQSFFTFAQLQDFLNPGRYQVRVRLPDGSWLTGETSLSAYQESVFPEETSVGVGVADDQSLRATWQTVASVDEYEVYATRLNDFSDVFESGNLVAAYPSQQMTYLSGTQANQASYIVEVHAERDASAGEFHIEFSTSVQQVHWQGAVTTPTRLGYKWAGSGDLELAWPGQSGSTYQLQNSEDLLKWQNLGNPLPGVTGQMSVRQAVTPTAWRYYRLSVQ